MSKLGETIEKIKEFGKSNSGFQTIPELLQYWKKEEARLNDLYEKEKETSMHCLFMATRLKTCIDELAMLGVIIETKGKCNECNRELNQCSCSYSWVKPNE